jgi:hypothetical protein
VQLSEPKARGESVEIQTKEVQKVAKAISGAKKSIALWREKA